MAEDKNSWFTSNEIKKKLKITGCELMHQREAGKLEFKKVGNAYFYKIPAEEKRKDD